jgi:thioesterase domain-containing protein
VIFGGYSFGGLIAFEMASLWRRRYGINPASLILLDAAIYTPVKISASDKENENEVAYAMQLFGQNEEDFVLNHFNKVAPLMYSSIQSPKHHGACLYLITPEAAVAGAANWWAARCPKLHTHSLPCSHQAVLGDAMVGRVSALINEHCRWVVESLDSYAS